MLSPFEHLQHVPLHQFQQAPIVLDLVTLLQMWPCTSWRKLGGQYDPLLPLQAAAAARLRACQPLPPRRKSRSRAANSSSSTATTWH